MQKYQDSIVNPDGTALQGVTVRVQTYPGAVDATIYSDDGVTTKTNPMTTDSLGSFSFYAADGRYQLVISGPGITARTVTDILLGNAVETSGTFTFTDASGGTPVPGSSGAGNWVRQGSMVYVSGRWKWNSNGQTAIAVLDGLPFPARSGLYSQCLEVASQGNTSYDGIGGHSRLFARIGIGETKLYFAWSDIPAQVVYKGMLDIADVHICGWYQTDP